MSDWIDVASVAELIAGTHRVVEADDVQIAVFNVDGEYHAIEDVCTHDNAPLANGSVQNGEIICPRHGARFCLRTGKALCAPAYEAVTIFPTRVENGTVQVRDDRWD